MQRCPSVAYPTRRTVESAQRPPTSAPSRSVRRFAAWVVASVGVGSCFYATAGAAVFRCPGKPAVYTSDTRLAGALGCESLDRRPVFATPLGSASVRELGPIISPSSTAKPAPPALVAAPTKAYVIPRVVQQERDDDRKRILQDELARDRTKLQALNENLSKARAQEIGPEVERIGQAIRRKEADIEALNRELVQAGR